MFLFQKNLDEISANTQELIDDCADILMTSTVCVQEFVHLYQIGKIYREKKRQSNIVDAEGISPRSLPSRSMTTTATPTTV